MLNKIIKFVGTKCGNPQGIAGRLLTRFMNILNQKQYRAVLDNINLEPDDVVLDIGFGNGYLINKLLKKDIQIKICGIDISNDMVNNVSKKYKRFIDDGYLNLHLENIAKTSFENETYNKIYTVNTMYFWNELEKCFSEIKRILKPDGIFLNAVYTREFLDKIVYTKYGYNKYSIDDVIKITENNGMTIVKLVEIKKNNTYCVISKNAAQVKITSSQLATP